jgi:hypothetical protein
MMDQNGKDNMPEFPHGDGRHNQALVLFLTLRFFIELSLLPMAVDCHFSMVWDHRIEEYS